MILCLSLTLSAAESEEELKINETVYVEHWSAFVELSYGEVPPSVVGLEWFFYRINEWGLMTLQNMISM